MNRRTWLKSFLIALASPSQAALARTQPVTRLDDVLEPLRAKHGLPALAGAVVSKGQIVGAAAVGARLLNSDKKVTVNDRFHLGSDTKAMTATLAGMAVEAGKLRWDTTIGDALGAKVPGIEPRLAAVTLEQLLSHSGGIPSDTDEILNLYFSPDAFKYDLPTQRLRILNAWKNHAPATKPGAEFHYANLGYVIAGAMIETAFGVSWEELIDNRIFTPLRLSTAGLGPQATTGKYDAPIGYQIGDDGAVTPMPWGPAAD
ncbi:MAG: serine hydrolase domain-containing protein, partial [Methylocystis sp.]